MEKIKPINTKVCRFLKAKNPHGTLEGGEYDWLMMDDANTIVWCLHSMGPVGPDNGLANPPSCVKGRACYQAPK